MSENPKEWPRVHTCLDNWCPAESDECKRCDGIVDILQRRDDIIRSQLREGNRLAREAAERRGIGLHPRVAAIREARGEMTAEARKAAEAFFRHREQNPELPRSEELSPIQRRMQSGDL